MTTPAAFAVGPRLLLSLVAGRGAYRLAGYASNIALLAAWERGEFSRYAAAIGSAGWLISLVSAGPEKAALKLVPRARRSGMALVSMLRTIGAYVPVPLVAAVAVMAAAAPSSQVSLHLAAAALYVTQGANLLLVGVFRSLGHTRRDVTNFVTLSAATVAFTVVTIASGIDPLAYLGGLLVATCVANLALLRGLARRTGQTPASTPRRRLARLLAATAVLMGASEVLANAAYSSLYLILSFTPHAGQSADLYLTGIGWTIVASLFYYLLRVFQPRTALRLEGAGARQGRARAVRLARLAVVLGLAWLGAAGVLIAVADLDATSSGPALVAVLGGLTLSRAPVFFLMSTGSYLMENADGRSLRVSAVSASVGLVAVAACGLALVPVLGAVGAVYAMAVREVVVGVGVLWYHRRRQIRHVRAVALAADGGTP